ncbi:MAG: hypothetical protein ACXWQ6_04170 [Candidatus Limnocylindrales bacterium]
MCLVLAACAALLASCASSSPTGSGSGGVSATTATPTPDPSSPAGRLASALTRLDAGYTFESTVTVAGKTATSATGRWVGGTSEVTVSSGGRSATYRTVGSQAWVQQSDGSWVATDVAVPGGDPLDAFRTPAAVELVSQGSTGLDLTATYPPAAFGQAGSDPIAVKVRIAPDGSVTLTYEATVNGSTATSTTALHPGAGLEPVAAPSGAVASPS